MKTKTFLSPEGEMFAIQYEEAKPTYAEPVPYWSANIELSKLRTNIAAAEAELRHATSRHAPTTEIMRLEQTLSSLKEELDRAEQPRRDQRKREQDGSPAPSNNTKQVVNWSAMSIADQTLVIQEAMKELRRVGADK